MFDVEFADEHDVDAIIDLLRMKHAEDGLGKFSDRRTRESVIRGAVTRNMARIGVIRGRRRIEATVGLFVDRPYDSDDQYIFDRWLFVHPEHRRSDHAKLLINFSKTVSKTLGLPLVMSAIINENTAMKVELYERQVPKGGAIFIYNPGVELHRETA